MKNTRFGGTGLVVSRAAIGTGQFGQQIDEPTAGLILAKAVDAGVNFIDTANSYPAGAELDKLGTSEEIVGRWVKGKRQQFVIASKFGSRVGPLDWDRGNSRKHILHAIDGSLRRLGTDYVDLYQLHMDDPETPLDETLEALQQVVASGKARYIGVSNFLAFRLAKVLGRQELLGFTRFSSAQPRYNLLHREIERELLPLCEEEKLAVLPYNPLAGGLLSGKYKLNDSPSQGRFSSDVGSFGAIYQDRYWHEKEFKAVGQISEVAIKQGIPVATLAIAWVLDQPAVTSVILGATRVEQLTDTLAALDVSLDGQLRNDLDEASIEFRKGDAERWELMRTTTKVHSLDR